MFVIEGDMEQNTTRLNRFTVGGSQDFIVGEDYPVVKQDARSLTVVMHDKKGHELKERLDVTGVIEK